MEYGMQMSSQWYRRLEDQIIGTIDKKKRKEEEQKKKRGG